MGVTWRDSASKHGISHDDALHAMTHALLYVPGFDAARVPGAKRPDLWIGPPRRFGDPLIEVMGERIPPRTIDVFHVMVADPRRLALLDDKEEGRR